MFIGLFNSVFQLGLGHSKRLHLFIFGNSGLFERFDGRDGGRR